MKKIQLIALFSIAMLMAGAVQAVTCTSVATRQTDWNKTNAWDATCGGQPAAGDNAIIAPGTNILVDKNTNNVANVTINNTGTLTIQNRNTLFLSGNLTLDAGGTFVAQAGSTVSLTGTNQTLSGNLTFANLTLGANTQVTLTGNIVINGTTNLTQASIASTCPNNFTVTNAAGTVVAQSCPLPLPIAEYRLDETSPSTVADSSANALNGTAVGGITVGGAGKVCGSYNFNGTDAYVSVADNALLKPTKVSVAAWVRHDSAAFKNWEAILTKGDTSYRMHLNGGCSLNTPTTNAFDFGLNTGCATADVSSTTVPVANQWYHVVGTYDGATLSLYINGASVGSVAYAGSVASNTFPLYIGANSQQAGRFWSGDLDEVKIYSSALTAAQVSTIYTNENAGKNWDGAARTCPSLIHHVSITAPLTGMVGTPESVVITPHNAAHAAIAGAGTIVLSTDTGLGDWTLISGTGTLTPGAANSGQATYAFGASETSVTLGFTYPSAGTVVLGVADTNATDLLLATPANEKANTITFTSPSFIFTNGACADGVALGVAGQTCTVFNWSPQVAGQDVANVFITAVNAAGVPTRLSRKNTRTRTIRFGLSCHDPDANAGISATFAGVTLPLCQSLGAMPATWSGTVTVTFNPSSPSSNIAYTFNYADVGNVALWMQNSATTSQVGSSGSFVVKPGGFVLSDIKRTSDGLANPGATSATGGAFVGAGNAFSATVTATTCTQATAPCTVRGATTPNYGKEKTPESVKLTPNLVTGLGLSNNPAVGGAFGVFGAAHPSGTPAGAAGVAHGTAFTWDEVGIITLTPSVGDGNYLGVGDVVGTTSGNVGRFYPDHFDTAVLLSALVPLGCPSGLTCPAVYNGMVYSGQPFSLSVTAKSASGATTQNYNTTSGFSKTVSLSAFDGVGSTTAPAGAGTLGVSSVTAFATGTLTEAAEKYTFTTVPTAPTKIYIRATDGEASSLRAVNPTTTSVEGGVMVASGRLLVTNAYGSELLPLTLQASAQYYDGAAWKLSSTDNASSLTMAASYDVMRNGTKTGATVPNPTGAATLTGGVLPIVLGAPGAGVTGTATVAPTVAAYLPVTSGAATFGVYRGSREFIYLRER